FWFPEAQFGCADGVVRTKVGYTGGSKPFPTYYSLYYHQKYLLRQHPTLLRSLGLNSIELLSSVVAARLNGYVGGYGSLKKFEVEVDDLQINEAQADMVRKILTGRRF
ncbi:PREDICTED: peptide methionine sulfoxide reductase-like, partial [Acropora digitifera]|uniref:peptide methionine sulfoxide reductase-like n=1 Tax=Acropora digitifera TaxID=70779 RepID=UPI00077ADB3B